MKQSAQPLSGRILLSSLISILLVIAGYLAWSYLSIQQRPASKTGSGVTLEHITIANIGEFSIFNLIAKEKGYFEKNGLDAEIQEYDAGPSALAALLEGKADFAVAADFVGVRHILDGKDLRVLSQVSAHKDFHFIARKDAGIEQPTDLKSKRIGVTKRSVGEFFLGRFLTAQGLSLSDVTIVDLSPMDIVQGIREGTLDGAVIFDPHAYNLQKELGTNLLLWSAQGIQNHFALAYTSSDVASTRSATVEAYLRSLLLAEKFAREQPQEAKQLVAAALQYDAAYVEYMWPNFIFALGLDQELILTMEDQTNWLMANQLVTTPRVPNFLDSLYFDGLQKVAPASVHVIQ